MARRVQKDGAAYFGPFYPATAMRQTLRLVRQLFPPEVLSVTYTASLGRLPTGSLLQPVTCISRALPAQE